MRMSRACEVDLSRPVRARRQPNMSFKKPVLGNARAKILLLGEPGAGKTFGALTFPAPAVIDAEGSVTLFGEQFDFVSDATKSVAEAIKMAEDVAAGRVKMDDGRPCQTLVIDSLTSLYNTVQIAAMGKNGEIDMQKWGLIKRSFSSLLDILYTKTDMHVVCTSWIKPKFTGNDKKTGELLADGEIMDGDRKSSYAFDLIFKLRVDPNTGKRSVLVMKARGIFGKHFEAGQVIHKPFSYELLAPIFEGLKGRGKHKTGPTEEESAVADKRMLEQGDEKNLKEMAAYALRSFRKVYPKATLAESQQRIFMAIQNEFGYDVLPNRASEVAPEHFKWAGDLYSEQAAHAPLAA